MDENKLSHEIIGAAIEVHRILGPGLLESAYQKCLGHELSLRGISYEQEKTIPLIYKDIILDCGYRVDFLVEGLVLVELKAVDKLLPIHEAQLLTYLKLLDYKLGLLINFNVPLLREGIQRIVNNL